MNEVKNTSGAIRLPLYIGIALALGVLIGSQVGGGLGSAPSGAQSGLSKMKQVLGYIQNDYVDEVDTDKMVDEAIGTMLEKLDPHTVYIPMEELKLMEGQLKGNFEGIGVEFNIFNDTIHVITALAGGPSEKLGIRAGDKIISVDEENVAGIGITNRQVVSKLRGDKGSKVKVEIYRKGEKELITYEIKRGVIPQYSLDVAYMATPEIGYIKISRFAATTYIEFKTALDKLKEQGMTKLILDLTGNPGGYMDKAIEIADEFLPDNQLIVYTQGKDSKYNESHISRRKGAFESNALVIMIDEGSASASEIVAGAMQDHDRALIVGRRSYGKGLVQRPMSLVDGSELRLTISRYYTPSGRSIQKPYNGKDEVYHDDFNNRFENGEVFSADSIVFDDSLRFETDNGRSVFGGGGIVPDVFVPLDTTGNSAYLNRLFTSNTMAEFALDYSQNHKAELEKIGKEKFINEFEVSSSLLMDLKKVAEKNGVRFDEKQFIVSKTMIKIYLKSYIGRGVWDNEAFYPIFNLQNEIYQKALTLFENTEAMALIHQN